jgi:hypothetical protein
VHRALIVFVLLSVFGPTSPAADAAEYDDFWNLGSIGATAELVKGRVEIRGVVKGQAAEGKLKRGDVIKTVGGESLGKDPIDALGRRLDAAEKAGSVTLGVERGGATFEVKLKLPKFGSYDGAFAAGTAKVKKHLKAAVAYVAGQQQGSGVWHKYRDGKPHRGDGITTATVMSALGLMAVDPKKSKKAIKAARGFVLAEVRPDALGPDATSGLHRNWPVALTTLFLAEFYAQTGDKTVRKRLNAMLARLAANQEPTGGWSHFPGFSEGPSYKSLSSLTALALIAQGVALKVGVKVSGDSITKGLDYLERCIAADGALSYSVVNGATGIQSTGRGCGALAAFHLHGRTSEKVTALETYTLKSYAGLLESHPAPLTGVLFAAMLGGLWQGESSKARSGFQARIQAHLVPFVTLARHPDGYYMAQPSPETLRVGTSQNKENADRTVHDPFWSTAIVLMLQSASKPKLVCLGAKPRKR